MQPHIPEVILLVRGVQVLHSTAALDTAQQETVAVGEQSNTAGLELEL